MQVVIYQQTLAKSPSDTDWVGVVTGVHLGSMHFSAASVERGAYQLTRAYKVADNSSVTGTTGVRLA